MAKDKPAPKPKKTAAQRAAELEAPAPPLFPRPRPEDLLSTGCTVLNQALSGTPHGGIPKAGYWHVVGESGSAKTWFTFCLFAEAARNPHFKDYRFVYDNAENGALLDVEKYFGRATLDRLVPPRKGQYGSTVVQEFYYHVELAVKRGPCIYVLDSMDALADLADEEIFDAEVRYYDTGVGKSDIKGSMGMNKAKNNRRNIGRIANQTLRENGSILVVISQTADKLNSPIPGAKTHSGGHALKFYAHAQTWAKVRADLKRSYKGKDREYGSLLQLDVAKNRVSGWHGKVPLVTFLADYGVSDVDTSVNYLIDEKHWKRPGKDAEAPARAGRRDFVDDDDGGGKLIAAPEFDYAGDAEGLVRLIQDQGREAELAALVGRVWAEIAAAVTPARKPRY